MSNDSVENGQLEGPLDWTDVVADHAGVVAAVVRPKIQVYDAINFLKSQNLREILDDERPFLDLEVLETTLDLWDRSVVFEPINAGRLGITWKQSPYKFHCVIIVVNVHTYFL